jgi:hypothetical protein
MQVFRAADAIAEGLATRNSLRSRAWQRVLTGVYADSRLEVDHNVKCRAAALVMPPRAAFCGLSAAWLYGVEFASRAAPVEVVVPRHQKFGPIDGLKIHLEPVPPGDVVDVGGSRVTSPLRTAWDIATQKDLVTSVIVLDALLHAKVVDRTSLGTLAEKRRGTRGYRLADRAFGLSDGRAESFPESRTRIQLILEDIPAPVPQFEVYDADGTFIARVDMAWPQAKVALEYDGHWHAAADQMHRDRRRLNRLVAAGWTVLHVTSERLRSDLPGLVREIRTALVSAAARRPL